MFEFLRQKFGAAEKSQGAAEKNKEKVEANRTGLSAKFFGSQSVEMFYFARKTKIQMLTIACRSLTSLELYYLKSLQLYCPSSYTVAYGLLPSRTKIKLPIDF